MHDRSIDRLWSIVMAGGGEICLAPSRLRIARSILHQVGGSRGCVHGRPSSIDDVSVR